MMATARRTFRIGRTFQLTSRPKFRPAVSEVMPSPKHLLTRFLAMPRWNEDTIQAAERVIEHYWARVADWARIQYRTDLQDDETEELIAQAETVIKDWRRMQSAKPLPTTAWLARQSTLKGRDERAIELCNRIHVGIGARIRACEAKTKQFKTSKAQCKERARVQAADRTLQRLKRHAARLEKIVPNVGWMAQVARSKAS